MKSFLPILFILLNFSAQAQPDCEDANSDLIYAYSHVKSAYNSNNISHLKYYANRSFEAFERSKEKLTKCGCETAYNLAYDAAELLAKVEHAKTYEDGRFNVKRAREIGKETMAAIDECTAVPEAGNEDEALLALQQEQAQLKLQQEALRAKEKQLKAKLTEQKEKELILKKKQLISTYERAISSNIETYNRTLKACNCNHETIEDIEHTEAAAFESVELIKPHYVRKLKDITTKYLDQLNSCH